MGVVIKNGSTDISSIIDWTSIQGTFVVTKQKGALKFDILIPNPSSPPSVPALGDTIYLYYNSSTLYFGGTVTELETVIDGGTLQRVHVTASDWGYKLDRMLVYKTYQNMDPADIVKDIIQNFTTDGFTTNNVQQGNFLVASIKFNYEQPSKALEALAKQIGWDWYIDPNKDVHFFFADTADGSTEVNPAPFDIEDGTGNIQFATLDVDVSIANLKNSIYVLGGTMFRAVDPGTTVDIYTTVAGQTVYPLSFPYDTTTTSGGGATIKVTIDGVTQSVGIYGQDQPGSFNCLYSAGASGGAQGGPPCIILSGDPGAGHVLKVYGNVVLPIVANVTSPNSITAYGLQEDVVSDKQIKSVLEAQARAEAELIQFDHPVYDVKFNTLTPGLMIGQTIKLNSTKLGITNKLLLIRSITVTGYSPNSDTKGLLFQVEALGSDNVTFNDIMMTLLQQSLAQNVTPDNTILQVVLPVAEGITIADVVTVTSGTSPYKWGSTSPQPNWGFFKWS